MADKTFKGKITAKGTDIAKYKNPEFPADVIKNWLRTRFTIDYLGAWEQLYNPNFKLVEFDQFKREAGTNAFVLSAEWRKENPDKDGNIRDHATIEQLLVLANIENINALYINKGMPQPERIVELNQLARIQLSAIAGTSSVKALNTFNERDTDKFQT